MSHNSFRNSLSPELIAQMQDWRQDFHQHPETAFEEHRTAAFVADQLESVGIQIYRGIGTTGVVGVLTRGNSNKSIALRADMDALAITEQTDLPYASSNNGRMHACGHDGHTAMLLGAASHLATEADFDGTVVFIFQPAEEHGAGAQAMLDDGLLERFAIDQVFALHNLPGLPAGHFAGNTAAIMAAEDNFEITVNGKGCHAAMPHTGHDSLVIAAEIIMAMQSLVSRSVDPMENAVVSFTEIETNGTVNVIPGQVVLKGDTRSLTPSIQDHIEATMGRIADGICQAHGATCQFNYQRNFIPTINSPDKATRAFAVARDLVGDSRVDVQRPPIMGSEDFGYLLAQRPGAYLFIGNGTEGASAMPLHNPEYNFNDEILETGARFWTELVLAELS